ncbi:hypothetical protein GWE18_00515 [Bradyrhizobium sp. CSA112]|uniref:hypothetical protein n=1 Tax=Bradyrhizobium sp. CSA112 TaxID=2699170 RepID=UPI0023B04EFB|nr:hypothetical protein [Bradyrhizobium sp. CSA112]MDE5451359.1 hypothetical protein [Bradyrhizobium sp. CSA112]
MTDLERLELILRRIMAKRKRDYDNNQRILNIDTQELLEEIADEIALAARS